jgi:enolase-phosphatase E1
VIELRGVRAVLTDIEGTTSSLAFVKDVLFPYARNALPAFVRDHEGELTDIAGEIREIVGKSDLSAQEMIGILLQWMDEDRKVTPLKSLQGMIWQTGYASGELQGHVYEDAVRGLRNWQAHGLGIYVYSSGSVAAQKLLFSHTSRGNLLPLFSGHFDTTTGPKLEARSYARIADSLGLPARTIVFLSDHSGETRAAQLAGMQTVLLVREPTAHTGSFARSFDDIALSG